MTNADAGEKMDEPAGSNVVVEKKHARKRAGKKKPARRESLAECQGAFDGAGDEGSCAPPDVSMFAQRIRLLDRMKRSLDAGDIVLVRAPANFGKTSLLRQCVHDAQTRRNRACRTLRADDCTGVEIARMLDAAQQGLAGADEPLIVIDDIPNLDEAASGIVLKSLLSLREGGVDLVVSCSTSCRAFAAALMQGCGDLRGLAADGLGKRGIEERAALQPLLRAGRIDVIEARDLCVDAREYATWARRYAISCTLDVYDLTLGIPSLVAALSTVTAAADGRELLEQRVKQLYDGIMREFRETDDPLYRLACFMVLMGKGSLGDIGQAGMRATPDQLERLRREYPIFRFGSGEPGGAESRARKAAEDKLTGAAEDKLTGAAEDRLTVCNQEFCCLGEGTAALAEVRGSIGKRRPAIAERVIKAQVKLERVDSAVELMRIVGDRVRSDAVLRQFPLAFPLAGQTALVREAVEAGDGNPENMRCTEDLLALMVSAIFLGEYRIARMLCRVLRERAPEAERRIAPGDWQAARLICELWSCCRGIDLPDLLLGTERTGSAAHVDALELHRRICRRHWEDDGGEDARLAAQLLARPRSDALSIPFLLLEIDLYVERCLHGAVEEAVELAERLERAGQLLEERGLAALSVRVRAALALGRVMQGRPLADERAFSDCGTVAVRESNLTLQLICLLSEGWQMLAVRQVANAQFRAQQVQKLAGERDAFLCSWGVLLQAVAESLSSTRASLREEALLIDLDQPVTDPMRAWAIAIRLSAARCDADLAAWFSLHKVVLLMERFAPIARLALSASGDRGDALRRLIPPRLAPRYYHCDSEEQKSRPSFHILSEREIMAELGQVGINLFGGFSVERNGHASADALWRRKRAGILASRLALSLGAFVPRNTIMDEIWPELSYQRSRDNLYVTVSALRAAFQQKDAGPQYLIVQGDGLALNREYVVTDVMRFDRLARRVLLERTGAPTRSVIEDCIELEKLYLGPLYVPDTGNVTFFVRARREYASKFVDSMVRGVDQAIDDGDLSIASWLVEATLKQAPTREDVIRRALVVYGLAGRRREVTEIYGSYIYYLQHHLHRAPDEETRKAYERIAGNEAEFAYN